MERFVAADAPKRAPPPPPKPAAPPKPAVPEADIELFRSLLIACNGPVNTNDPPGGGVTDLRIVKAMLANGASPGSAGLRPFSLEGTAAGCGAGGAAFFGAGPLWYL